MLSDGELLVKNHRVLSDGELLVKHHRVLFDGELLNTTGCCLIANCLLTTTGCCLTANCLFPKPSGGVVWGRPAFQTQTRVVQQNYITDMEHNNIITQVWRESVTIMTFKRRLPQLRIKRSHFNIIMSAGPPTLPPPLKPQSHTSPHPSRTPAVLRICSLRISNNLPSLTSLVHGSQTTCRHSHL